MERERTLVAVKVPKYHAEKVVKVVFSKIGYFYGSCCSITKNICVCYKPSVSCCQKVVAYVFCWRYHVPYIGFSALFGTNFIRSVTPFVVWTADKQVGSYKAPLQNYLVADIFW